MEVYLVEIGVPTDTFNYYDDCLSKNKMINTEFKKEEIIYTLNAKFSNGYTVSLEVFTGEDNVMSNCYLYNSLGQLIITIECDEGLDTEYIFDLTDDNIKLQRDIWIEQAKFCFKIELF